MDRWVPSSERYDIEMSLAQRTVHETKKCDPRWDARIETRDGAVYVHTTFDINEAGPVIRVKVGLMPETLADALTRDFCDPARELVRTRRQTSNAQ